METNKAQNTYQNADQNAALKDNQNSFHDNHSTRQDGQSAESPLDAIKKNVLKKSVEQDHVKNTKIVGFDFNIANGEINFNHLLANYKTIGFQATNFGLAIDIVNEMIQARNNNNSNSGPTAADTADNSNSEKEKGCKIFLGYTSNLVSSGLREMIRFLVQTNQVDVVVSSAGGIEEDFIKCLGDTYLGDFTLDGAKLRSEGLNRIGNLLVPNSNYCKFEDWVVPILDQLLLEQKRDGIIWTPSSIIKRLGKEINHPESIYYWAYKNDIPVYCPALTDGSLGDMIYFHSFKNPGLIIDIAADIRSMNDQAVFAKKTGMLILGGGVIKHHICNANLMRNGSDYAVYINTGQEFDGSDAGARCDEAVSWGKIRAGSRAVKVYADATLVFPLLVSQTFAKNQ